MDKNTKKQIIEGINRMEGSAGVGKMFRKHTRPLGEHEALLSNLKIREMLGFSEEHDWRKYVIR